jgi:phasin family protein
MSLQLKAFQFQPVELEMTDASNDAAGAMKEQISKLMQSFKLPDVDMAALVESQRKNIDAMAKVAQLTTEGATAISQRQLEIFRATSEKLSLLFRDMKLTSAERSEIAKKAFEAAMTNARELAEMTTKSNNEVFDVVKQRLTENFEQMRNTFMAGKREG